MKHKIKFVIIPILLCAVFMLLGWRVYFLQKYRSRDYKENSSRQQFSIVDETGRRGTILDASGRVLAASNKIDTVFAEPRALLDLERLADTADQLAQILDMPSDEIRRYVHDSYNPGYVKIKEDITPVQREQILSSRFRGIGIESSWSRYYPMEHLSSHLLGFVGAENTGLSGLEYVYNQQLTGQKGRDVLFVNAAREPIGLLDQSDLSEPGSSLMLTVDSVIQQHTREALSGQCENYEAESGIAIVMNPWNGEIMAMCSWPDFDPQDFAKTSEEVRRNRALTDPYEPGSIFKPLVASLALDAGIVGYNEKIDCEKGDYHGKGFGRIGEYGNHQYEDLTVKEILIHSSNIGMAKIGQRMGPQRLYEGVKLFGFGRKTGIDLPGEDAGVLHPVDTWTGYSVTRIPFGHEITVTSLQILRAYAVLANGGRLVRPHIVKAIADPSGRIISPHAQGNLSGHILKPETAQWIVRDALTAVVNEGTGKKAALEQWQVFGKTGTANIANREQGGYDEKNYIASFAGGAPAEHPEIVVLVSIRKPNRSLGKGYTGGTVAGPVAGEIIEKTLTYLKRSPRP